VGRALFRSLPEAKNASKPGRQTQYSRRLADARFEEVESFGRFAEAVRCYWKAEVYPNRILPGLAAVLPLILAHRHDRMAGRGRRPGDPGAEQAPIDRRRLLDRQGCMLPEKLLGDPQHERDVLHRPGGRLVDGGSARTTLAPPPPRAKVAKAAGSSLKRSMARWMIPGPRSISTRCRRCPSGRGSCGPCSTRYRLRGRCYRRSRPPAPLAVGQSAARLQASQAGPRA
jgi:hypothetical protein